ncbi:MAG: glutathione S-transferase family protein [Deltaproteobacteria bacterium]|nr:glutathione S-transferase family protein [Deltaproteobacteria bacterium]
MAIKLYHHPFSRAGGVVWALEEVGVAYELVWVDITKGEHKGGDVAARNPMGKIPMLVDGDAVVTEAAAIDLYLADRYALGRLAPRPDDPKRGAYLRWSLFAPSVIEPAVLAKLHKWEYRASAAGFGEHDAMLASVEQAVTGRDYVLGDTFSMADVIFGGTLRYMIRFKLIEPSPAVAAYVERLAARPALQRADARNAAVVAERGLAT